MYVQKRLLMNTFGLATRFGTSGFYYSSTEPGSHEIVCIIYSTMNSIEEKLGKQQQINLAFMKQLQSEDKKLPRQWVKQLVEKYISIVKAEPNVLFIQEPVIIIGDIHGQFYDLLKILSLCPSMETEPKEHLLFLGDYVDRGPMGVEVILLLMAIKIKYPKKVIMLRGNHETIQMTQTMNFYQQVCEKYDQALYFSLMLAFNSLPLVCIINNSYFCVHGGITAQAESIEELNKLNRFVQIPMTGSLCDLVWSDPVSDDKGSTHSEDLFIPNYQRNCSIFFGSEHARGFLKRQKLITIIRAHEVQLEGYKQHFWPKWKDIPMVYTLFSAPNYCGSYGNLGAILTIVNSQFNIRQFKETNPKYYLPPRYNAFSFSLPHLQSFLDQILKRMAQKWVNLKMPELKGVDTQTVIKLYLNCNHCKSLKFCQSKDSKMNMKKKATLEISEVEAFHKSQNYYLQSEKRPSSIQQTK